MVKHSDKQTFEIGMVHVKGMYVY